MWSFKPILKDTIWGGDRLAPFKGLCASHIGLGESWELSGVEGSESIVVDGPDAGLTLNALIDRYGVELMGKLNFKKYGSRFPLLIKFIDAAADLSVQVHPDDEMARSLGHQNGKTEMWYVVKANKGAKLALGFNRQITAEEFPELIRSGEIEKALRFIPVNQGDAFLIPARVVHAIGKGIMLAEIQQTSDDTFRLYDYRRKDAEGKERTLHIELGTKASDLDFTDGKPQDYKAIRDIPVNIATTPYFTTNVLHLDMEVMRDYREFDTFVILIAVDGKATVTCSNVSRELTAGHTLLLPASASGITITPDKNFSCLETYIR